MDNFAHSEMVLKHLLDSKLSEQEEKLSEQEVQTMIPERSYQTLPLYVSFIAVSPLHP